jgi:hypothetical protein
MIRTQPGKLAAGWPDEFVKKIAQNGTQAIFVKNTYYTPFTVAKKSFPIILATFVTFKNGPKNERPFGENLLNLGPML